MTRSILMLAWEYPPNVIGGLARHAGYLSRALAGQGDRVIVLTQGDGTLPLLEDDHGVQVVRLPVHEPRPRDFTGWVKRLNFEMVERAVNMFTSGQRFDIIHAHDWLAAYAGKTLKHGLAVPLVATVHATEYGRNNGLHNDLQRYISTVEWSLTYEAWRVICCSRFMEQEIHRVFQTPVDKIRIVPNGIHVPDSDGTGAQAAPDDLFRRRFAAPDEQLIFFMGRLVYEKGVHVLLDAMPDIVRRRPGTRLVIAGDGPLRDEFERQADRLGISHLVTFYGFADDEDRDRFLRVSQVAVFPSLYEPFGIVALEAMAAQVPVVVGKVGGFAEIVRHGETGLHAPPGDAAKLAEAIVTLLSNGALAAHVRDRALRDVEANYTWSQIAAVTADIYEEVLREYEQSRWDAAEHRRRSDDLSALHVLQRLLHHMPAGYDDAGAGGVGGATLPAAQPGVWAGATTQAATKSAVVHATAKPAARATAQTATQRGDRAAIVDEVPSRYADTRTSGKYPLTPTTPTTPTTPAQQQTATPARQEAATPARQEAATPARQEVATPARQEVATVSQATR